MAQVKYGAIVTEIKGKVSGQIFQAGKQGMVIRNNNAGKGTASVEKVNAMCAMSRISQLWRGLSDAERLTWLSVINDWQFLDKFGAPYIGSAYQVFCAYNRALSQMGLATVDTPSVPASATDPVSVELDITGGVMTALWDTNAGASSYYLVYASKCYPPSQKAFVRPFYYMGLVTGSLADLVFTNEWTARFGTPIVDSVVDIKVVSRAVTWPKEAFVYTARGVVA